MEQRRCVICGKPFSCYPSDNKVTCSKECWRERQRRLIKAKPVKWSDEAKKRASARGQTENLKLGTEAAKKSPLAGRYETNKTAKIWELVDPSGNVHVVRNLANWAREHTELFGKPRGDRSAKQIASGFRAIEQTLAGNRGAPRKPRGTLYYFGWTLQSLPRKPDDKEK